MILTSWLSRNVFRLTRRFLKLDYGEWSYSQEGEDMILSGIFYGVNTGFYVDVGALHPRRFSNTHRFYKRGWRGINLDPTPGSMELFQRERPRDINLEIGISNEPGNLVFYQFKQPALNTCSEKVAREREASFKIISTLEVETKALCDVLSQYLPDNTPIDILDIDVEGFDFDVLKSNDWVQFRPRVILVEALNVADAMESAKSEMSCYLLSRNYRLTSKTSRTLIFVESDFLSSLEG